MIDFTGKSVFVTGAASGMGKASALLFAKAGADVAVADLNYEGACAVAKEIEAMGRKSRAYALDVSNEEQVERVGDASWKDFDGFDAVVHAAGVVLLGLVREYSAERFDKIVDINLRGTFLINKKFSTMMMERRYGRIVNFASISSKIGESYNAPYCATKAGVALFTQSLALEMAEYNVTVNAVAPGKIMTELTMGAARWWGEKLNITADEFIERVRQTIPAGRFGTAEEVADCVMFLASDMAAYITGQVFTVAGGQTLI